MISAMQLDESHAQEEPPFVETLLGALEKPGETVHIRPKYYRVRTTKAKGLETTCVTGHEAYEFPMLLLSLTDAKGGKCCSVQSQINALSHVGECHQGGLLREEDTQWSENLECHAAFNGLKQAMIEGPSLGVVDTTKIPIVEAEQFNCVLGEYLHHCVDGRQRNWVSRAMPS
uniref:RNA-directed DNA polymerase-like protein n=1 Tax=Cucumis melo TaxID=3656 RepID=A0A9I9EJZ5_CUCME